MEQTACHTHLITYELVFTLLNRPFTPQNQATMKVHLYVHTGVQIIHWKSICSPYYCVQVMLSAHTNIQQVLYFSTTNPCNTENIINIIRTYTDLRNVVVQLNGKRRCEIQTIKPVDQPVSGSRSVYLLIRGGVL